MHISRSVLLTLSILGWLNAQNPANHPAKELQAYPLKEIIRIDGILSEDIWNQPGATGFTQRDPIEGNTPSQRSEIVVAYDAQALYFGVKFYDSAPDSITRRLVRRDESTTADRFLMGIDPWHDHRTGFFFTVNAAGSIQDGTLFNDDGLDDSWDGVWESAVEINAEGWFIEIRIPYSQLRFPDRPVHTWGINFIREIERHNESDYWSLVPKAASGRVSWFGHLNGIEGIERPAYVELLPYSAGKSAFSHPAAGDPFNDGSLLSGQVGLDIKFGVTSSLTLDATFNPDFGQVEVDPAVVNLSDFETFFPEKRPFFIEGRDIFRFGSGGVNNNWSFNYGNPDHFYSRRIGRAPQGSPTRGYDFSSIPSGTTILGAAKLSGKLTPEWSIGVISALTAREYAEYDSQGVRFQEEVEPLSSYNIIRLLREFKDGRHGLGILSAFMVRDLRTENLARSLTRSAIDTGIDGWITLDEDRTYVVTGWLSSSRIAGEANVIEGIQRSSPHYFGRPDVDYLGVDTAATDLSGMAGRVYINKQKGNVIFNSGIAMVSPSYEVNDLGFQWNGDQINWHGTLGYQTFEPGKVWRTTFLAVATFRNWDFGGNNYGSGYFLISNGQLLNYWSANLQIFYNPETVNKNLTRGGVMTTQPPSFGTGGGISTDRRKAISLSLGFFLGRATREFRSINAGITWKPSSTMELSLNPSYSYDVTEATWVGTQSDPLAEATFGTRYLYAETVQRSFSMGTRLSWSFSPTLSLQLFAQPLIFAIDYFDYKELTATGSFDFNIYGRDGNSTIVGRTTGDEITYTVDPDGAGPAGSFNIDNRDFNLKSLRGNAVLRWEYRPGSVFFFAWTHNRSDIASTGLFDLAGDINALMAAPGDNIFLLKFTYWLAP